MSVIRHCADCGVELDPNEIVVDVRDWDRLHANHNEAIRVRDDLAGQLRGAVEAIKAARVALGSGQRDRLGDILDEAIERFGGQ